MGYELISFRRRRRRRRGLYGGGGGLGPVGLNRRRSGGGAVLWCGGSRGTESAALDCAARCVAGAAGMCHVVKTARVGRVPREPECLGPPESESRLARELEETEGPGGREIAYD
jgi:hypothetical protein